ncbi:MAG: hypothetical protein ACIWVG_10085 [Gloeotrichia echinulata HAB0833]
MILYPFSTEWFYFGDVYWRQRLGGVQVASRHDGIEQIGINTSSSAGQNFTNSITGHGETSTGKILKRLEFIENAYISYLESDKQHLEDRLLQNKGRRESFEQALQELKQEVYDLVSTYKPTEEPEEGL